MCAASPKDKKAPIGNMVEQFRLLPDTGDLRFKRLNLLLHPQPGYSRLRGVGGEEFEQIL